MRKRVILTVVSLALVLIVFAVFILWSIAAKSEGIIYSGKYEKVVSLIQNDREISVIDASGDRRIFMLTDEETKYPLVYKGKIHIRQNIDIDGKQLSLNYHRDSKFTSNGYELTLRPGKTQKFYLLFMPQWKISYIIIFSFKFLSVEQYYGKVKYERTVL